MYKKFSPYDIVCSFALDIKDLVFAVFYFYHRTSVRAEIAKTSKVTFGLAKKPPTRVI